MFFEANCCQSLAWYFSFNGLRKVDSLPTILDGTNNA